MFIGGNPGSTAGGVKTTSAIALFLYVRSNIDRSYGINVFGRRLEEDAVKRAGAICTINLTAALAASILIMAIQPVGMADVLFETFSAIGTVGMTTGITRSLLPASRIVIILLMYCGPAETDHSCTEPGGNGQHRLRRKKYEINFDHWNGSFWSSFVPESGRAWQSDHDRGSGRGESGRDASSGGQRQNR